RRRGDRPRNPRRECAAGGVRTTPVRARACQRPAGPLMFSRVLVANRGDVAVRVIRALHEIGAEAVAVYSTADAGALHTRLADRAVCLVPPPAAQCHPNMPSIVAAAEITGCHAI